MSFVLTGSPLQTCLYSVCFAVSSSDEFEHGFYQPSLLCCMCFRRARLWQQFGIGMQ